MSEKMFYTINEVAEIFRVNYFTILNWIREGKINSIKVGKKRLIPANEVEKLIRKGGK